MVQMIALVSLLLTFAGEILNIYCLVTQPKLELVIVHAVALEIIVELPGIYMSSLNADHLKTRIFANGHLHIENKGSEIKFWDRDFGNKVFRSIYKIIRALFCSCIFYF
jgi:hypothetical protein